MQPKLRISHPGDRYEREADRVADQVMRMPASEVSEAHEVSLQSLGAEDAQTQTVRAEELHRQLLNDTKGSRNDLCAGWEEDQDSFSINVARHFIRTQVNPARAGDPRRVKCKEQHECDVEFSTDLVINVWWNTRTKRVRAALQSGGDSMFRCFYEYSCDAKGQLTYTLITCLGARPPQSR